MKKINKEKQFFIYNNYKLAYRIYGDSSGFPIFVNYGLIGSIELPSDFIKEAKEINIKLFILERPGYGDSDFIEMKSVVEWADIVDKFLSHLKISEFGTIGISAGAPYAYSIAHAFPDRLTGGIYILSGVPNVLDDIVYVEYPPKHKKYYERYKSSSVKEIATEMTKYLTKYKYLLFWSKKKRSVINASLANDCKGVALVIKLQVSDWGFDVYNIKKEINLWHSQNDPEIPFLTVEKMTGKMQRVKLHIQKRKSHFPSKETINELFETINKTIKNKKTKSTLKEVPETMLWTLHNRAVEALRSDGIIKDEKAIEIYKSINYDYEKNFGKAEPSHAVRSLDFDREIRGFLEKYPDGTIVNLGEGLETQRFRFNENNAFWISVDVPEAIKMRERFIQPDERHIHLSVSATDINWFDAAPKDKPVFITAQGLFMYFTEKEVKTLLKDIHNTFQQVQIMFDTIPIFLSKKTLSEKGWRKTKYYATPKMTWGINRNKIVITLKNWLGSEIKVTDLGYSTFPRGARKWIFLFMTSAPLIKNFTPTIIKIDF